MKKTIPIILLLALWLTGAVKAQSKKYDSLALLIIDRMTDMIGEMESCQFRLTVANDVAEHTRGIVKHFTEYEVYMRGSDKLLVNAHGHKGHRQFMYNGRQIAWFSFDDNNYDILPAPPSTLKMIDSLHHHYDFEFPAADFFYPAFTDDLLENADSIRFLGLVRIDGKEYFHILAHGRRLTFQLWINNDVYNLPAKFAITYIGINGSPQYFASFHDWQVNPQLPVSLFDFLPPPGAARIRIMSKTDR